VLGLESSGKTTIVYKLKLPTEMINAIPTIGFNQETIEHRELRLKLWDVGGSRRMYPLWEHYVNGTKAVAYVVDSNDKSRLAEAKETLHTFINKNELSYEHPFPPNSPS
jgi:ADP-ribosylation factor protein 1